MTKKFVFENKKQYNFVRETVGKGKYARAARYRWKNMETAGRMRRPGGRKRRVPPPLDCTGLSRFPEVNFRKNSFHSGEISRTLRPRFQHAASAAGESSRNLAAHECPQEASTHGPRSGHVRTRRAQMDTKSPRRGTGGFSCDFVLSFVDVYVITSRSRPLCFRGSCSP